MRSEFEMDEVKYEFECNQRLRKLSACHFVISNYKNSN